MRGSVCAQLGKFGWWRIREGAKAGVCTCLCTCGSQMRAIGGGGGGGGSAHVARFAATPAVVDTVTAAEHIQPRCGQNSK